MKTRLFAVVLLALIALVAMAAGAYAQFGGRNRFGGGGFNGDDRGPTGGRCLVPGSGQDVVAEPQNLNRFGFVYARLRYHMQPWWRQNTPEAPWHHDYPDGDTMFAENLGKLTGIFTEPNSYQIVDVDSKELFKYPFVYMSEPGYLDLLPADVKNLREYFDRGGFMLIDDFRGVEGNSGQWDNMQYQMAKVFPDRTIEAVTAGHPIFHSFYELNPLDMEAPYFNPGESGPVQFMAISDDKGRIQVMIDFNNDISEYWQALDVGACSIHEAGRAVQLGVNYAIYAMTH